MKVTVCAKREGTSEEATAAAWGGGDWRGDSGKQEAGPLAVAQTAAPGSWGPWRQGQERGLVSCRRGLGVVRVVLGG